MSQKMTAHHYIGADITLQDAVGITLTRRRLALSPRAIEQIEICRQYLESRIRRATEPIYGITTGFGSLYNISIPEADLANLQRNLVMSHACGVGDLVPPEIVRLMLLMKVQSLSYGNSGVAVSTVQRLIDYYNADALPVVYQQGSLGASGDLAPLAHLSLPLLGLGQLRYNGSVQSAADVNRQLGLEPLALGPKEGLALLNGTQFMGAYGVWLCYRSERLLELATQVACMSLEAFDGRLEPFTAAVHRVRPHLGQSKVAALVRQFLAGSAIMAQPKVHVQDPYSFRCIPQVHGASMDALDYVRGVFQMELNSATDNPTIFPSENMIISAGNFHGQPLGLALDFLAMALAEIGSISERRTYQLISGKRGLPSFLVAEPGLNSGFMIPQYTAASIVSQSKMLCMPSSVDSIESSQGQEDHVSMGANAALKCWRVFENTERVIAIELLNAAQALEFRVRRGGVAASALVSELLSSYRRLVRFVETDEPLYVLLAKSVEFVRANSGG